MVSDGFVGADTAKEVGPISGYSEGDEIPTTKFVFLDRVGANGNRQSVAKVECHCSRGITRVEDIPWYYIRQGRRTECENCRRNVDKLSYRKFATKGLGLKPRDFYWWNENVWGFETKERPTAGQLYGMQVSLTLKKLFQTKETIRKVFDGIQEFDHSSDNYIAENDGEMRLYEDGFVICNPYASDYPSLGYLMLGSYFDLRKQTYWSLRQAGYDKWEIGHPYGDND